MQSASPVANFDVDWIVSDYPVYSVVTMIDNLISMSAIEVQVTESVQTIARVIARSSQDTILNLNRQLLSLVTPELAIKLEYQYGCKITGHCGWRWLKCLREMEK